MPDGNNFLNLSVALDAPVDLLKGRVKQTWAISNDSTEAHTEVYGCEWQAKAPWKCLAGVAEKPLY